jgi:hypothetical protein
LRNLKSQEIEVKNDAEDYPIEYLWYVFLACLIVAAGVAVVAAFLLRSSA